MQRLIMREYNGLLRLNLYSLKSNNAYKTTASSGHRFGLSLFLNSETTATIVSARFWCTFKTASDSPMIEEMPKPLSFIEIYLEQISWTCDDHG